MQHASAWRCCVILVNRSRSVTARLRLSGFLILRSFAIRDGIFECRARLEIKAALRRNKSGIIENSEDRFREDAQGGFRVTSIKQHDDARELIRIAGSCNEPVFCI
jgi:hypothetical protein